MNRTDDMTLAREVIRVRLSQMIINERNRKGEFRVPIHLALGHEAIAVAVSMAMGASDQLILTHRNVHYNLARSGNLRAKINEYLLSPEGEAQGQLGCMNLFNEKAGVIYTSSILGNNLPVAAGVALANRVKNSGGAVFVITGDGAMEEGAFYESMLLMRACDAAAVVIVENNEWSMATRIEERRKPVDLSALAASLGVSYHLLEGNRTRDYLAALTGFRTGALSSLSPVIVEVRLRTLGDWRIVTPAQPEGRFVNYHAGIAPNIKLSEWPVIEESAWDPVHVLTADLPAEDLKPIASSLYQDLLQETQ